MRLLSRAILVWFLTLHAAWALESAPVTTARTTATLISAVDNVEPNQPFRVALRLRIMPGWHTYWKNPGDAGAPPEILLTVPQGAQAGPIEYATPDRMPEGPLMTYGYAGEVLFPVTITGLTSGGRIQAEATWLVCKDICVPEEGRFTLDLAAGKSAPSAQAPLFATHDRAIPRLAPWTTRITPDGRLSLQGAELRPDTVREAWFIPDAPDAIRHDAPQPLTVTEGGITLPLRLTPAAMGKPLTGLVSVRDRTGQQASFQVNATPGPSTRADAPPLPRVLGFAFLGGLILNLMPCVFPVLAMKVMALARGASPRQARAHAAFYTLGVLTTFAALGLGLVAARTAGAAIGWGFQFQSPVFVIVMSWLMLLVGLNLSGVFQIGGSVAGVGSSLAQRGGHAGSFFTGLLAVLVATPCTAPFMGVALAAGLAAPPGITLAVFIALGLGLAAPYLVLSLIPNGTRILPKTGPWMERFKQFLAFPMYGSAAWLLWVASQSAGPDGVLVAAVGGVILALAVWAVGITQAGSTRAHMIGLAGLALAGAASVALLANLSDAPASPSTAAQSTDAYSTEKLSNLRGQGRGVFVNMTAAWCVTCLVNERIALRTDTVRSAFAEQDIAYLKGDWTRHDPAITAYLREFERDGVPLYVFYPPRGGAPVVLPQILTEGIVLAALRDGRS